MARTRTTTYDQPDDDGPEPTTGDYKVVARRYRPQKFEDVVGQDHVVQALRNAIRLNRVTHAYLFCGTRGVGKTSMARIFAKCLNCAKGPTEEPCQVCDICEAIAVGQDVDVIEIDGASNNGVEAVRELRQNAGLRPSRARFKIYYIDEVHMLSTGAFNALLKTLEEPPEHVKFFFATTEANKIPITVLSRCQRFDFAGIGLEQIVDTLAEICAQESIEADRDALQVIARRAGGSMRDAQSLLEQLLSSAGRRLTADRVHQLLGIAADETILGLLDALVDHDPAGALQRLDEAVSAGVQPSDLLGGTLEFLRDVMVLAEGAQVAPLAASPSQRPRLQAIVDRWQRHSILAALQILAEARGRLRGSSHGRLLVELALVRVARLEDFAELGDLIGRLAAMESGAVPPPAKKKPAPIEELRRSANGDVPQVQKGSSAPLDLDAVRAIWPEFLTKVGAKLGGPLTQAQPAAISGPNVLVIRLPAGYNWVADECDTTEARIKIESTLRALLGGSVVVRFERTEPADELPSPSTAPVRGDELADDPLVKKVIELFEARPVLMEAVDRSEPSGA